MRVLSATWSWTSLAHGYSLALGTRNSSVVLTEILIRFAGSQSVFKRFKYDVANSTDQGLLNSQLRNALRSSASPTHIQSLLLRGADVNCVDSLDYTPLLLALTASPSENMLDTVQLLCEFGANVNYSNGVFFGETPLHFAATLNEYALIELLFRYNGNVHARNHAGYTPLHVAAQNGNEASAIALFLCGADLNVQETYCGYTPLHLAVIGQFEHVVRATVSLGARINQSDNCGLTAIDRCNSREIREFLIGALHPGMLSLQSVCLSIVREKTRKTSGVCGFDDLPLPFTLKSRLKLQNGH